MAIIFVILALRWTLVNSGCTYDKMDTFNSTIGYIDYRVRPPSVLDYIGMKFNYWSDPWWEESPFSISCYDVRLDDIARVPYVTRVTLRSVRTVSSDFDRTTFNGEGYERSVRSFAMTDGNLTDVLTVPYDNLRKLNLSDNKIVYVNWTDVFKLNFIESIDLSGNRLTTLNSKRPVNTNRPIDLSVGDIGNLIAYDRLEMLILSDNRITVLVKLFAGTETGRSEMKSKTNTKSKRKTNRLRILRLDRNLINRLDERLFYTVPKLIELNLADNRLNDLKPNLFVHQTELRLLSLARNPLKKLSSRLFRSTANLKHLDLSGTSIQSIASWPPMPNLIELDLSYNGLLTRIDDDFFVDRPRLERLNLNNGKLTYVPLSTVRLKRLKILNTTGTDLKRSCRNQWFSFWSDENGLTTADDLSYYHRHLKSLKCPPFIAYITPKRRIVYPSLIIRCLAYGNPKPEIIWNNPVGEKIHLTDSYEIESYGYENVLRIVNELTYNDLSGVYLCKAVNELGEDTAEIEIRPDDELDCTNRYIIRVTIVAIGFVVLQLFRSLCSLADGLNDYFYEKPEMTKRTRHDVSFYFKPAIYSYIRHVNLSHVNQLDLMISRFRRKVLLIYTRFIKHYKRYYRRSSNTIPGVVVEYMHIQLNNMVSNFRFCCFKEIDTLIEDRIKLNELMTEMENYKDDQLMTSEEKMIILNNPLMREIIDLKLNTTLSSSYTHRELTRLRAETNDYSDQLKRVVCEWCSSRNIEYIFRNLKVPKLEDTPSVKKKRNNNNNNNNNATDNDND